jgi:hypothetical protein
MPVAHGAGPETVGVVADHELVQLIACALPAAPARRASGRAARAAWKKHMHTANSERKCINRNGAARHLLLLAGVVVDRRAPRRQRHAHRRGARPLRVRGRRGHLTRCRAGLRGRRRGTKRAAGRGGVASNVRSPGLGVGGWGVGDGGRGTGAVDSGASSMTVLCTPEYLRAPPRGCERARRRRPRRQLSGPPY